MTDQTPTPRTDGEDRYWIDPDDLGKMTRETVRIDFARELERENAALRAALRELVACKQAGDEMYDLNMQTSSASFMQHEYRFESAWAAARALVEKGVDMLNDEQKQRLFNLACRHNAHDTVAYVESLLAAERERVIEECAIRCAELEAGWLDGLDASQLGDYARGRVHAFNEAAERLRALKGK